MNTDRVTHLREAIRQRPNGWNLRWFNTGMQQSPHPRFAPTGCHRVEIFLEVAKNNVTVTVDQRRSGRHRRAETRFRPILPLVVDGSKGFSSAGWFQNAANHCTEA